MWVLIGPRKWEFYRVLYAVQMALNVQVQATLHYTLHYTISRQHHTQHRAHSNRRENQTTHNCDDDSTATGDRRREARLQTHTATVYQQLINDAPSTVAFCVVVSHTHISTRVCERGASLIGAPRVVRNTVTQFALTRVTRVGISPRRSGSGGASSTCTLHSNTSTRSFRVHNIYNLMHWCTPNRQQRTHNRWLLISVYYSLSSQ